MFPAVAKTSSSTQRQNQIRLKRLTVQYQKKNCLNFILYNARAEVTLSDKTITINDFAGTREDNFAVIPKTLPSQFHSTLIEKSVENMFLYRRVCVFCS